MSKTDLSAITARTRQRIENAGATMPAVDDSFCEQRPYPGAGYHCLLRWNHWGPHSDLTIMWNGDGEVCNADGTPI